MKRYFVLLVALLMLCGCVNDSDGSDQTTGGNWTQDAPGIYESDSELEQQTGGAIRVYPLGASCAGIASMGGDLLLFAEESVTQIQVLTGINLSLKDTVTLDTLVRPESAGVQIRDNGMCYYDAGSREMVILDENLNVTERVALPEDAQGTPVMNAALDTVYYCTADSIRALDIETGIARLVRQEENASRTLTQAYFDGRIIGCRETGVDGTVTTCYIDAENGMLLGQDQFVQNLDSFGDNYFLTRTRVRNAEYLFGSMDGEARVFLPGRTDAAVFSAVARGGAVTVRSGENGSNLDYYDFQSGLRTASVQLTGITDAGHFLTDENGYIWFIAYDTTRAQHILCRWETALSAVEDETVYTSQRYTAENPNVDGLGVCQNIADALNDQYGIDIRIWRDAVTAPWENATAEYRPEIFEDALAEMEQILALFPDNFFRTLGTAGRSNVIHISLVGSLAGNADAQQTWVDGNAYIALEMGERMEAAFYRALYRVMDTYVMNRTGLLDDWDAADPVGDRAQVFANAMASSTEEQFQSRVMQENLRTLCEAIREAFELDDYEAQLPWEQYLDEPLY